MSPDQKWAFPGLGEIRAHRRYGGDFNEGYRSDAHLGTVLQREGVETLDQLLKKQLLPFTEF